ncbi:adaptin N terminal region-domain-containing protein [Collybia nuda]|uniref:Adaptin N terminal region-domain-containing protein n=1 Tax=Collybia nuda TaxID=64659 RepID=A0A9P5YCW5_9AGAR|nr:adaptin N terminal region-domain-containing protein [Collybia nuda]
MSGQYLNAITENASRLGMRLQESFSEHTRDLAIPRTSGTAYLDTSDDRTKDIRRQLDSNSDREKLDALKRLVALISKGRNVSEYFAQVVKNVASQNLEIRKLVYIYLLRYAEQEPDLALLSINTFQKDLTDSNPLIRAMALRVLSGIKVPMIGSIVVLAIKKCAADMSPYVRKGAALAIPKCFQLDTSHLPALISIIQTLLNDRSSLSIGSVVVAFEGVCPTRLDLIHQQYRRLCRILIDVDEWGQVGVLNLLLRYARTMLPRPIVAADSEELDNDVKLLLTSAEPLLHSRNPAVVLAVTRVFYYAGTPSYISKVVHPLLRLLSISKEAERIVLVYLLIISRNSPGLFTPYYSRFLMRTDDLRQVKECKIKLLLSLMTIDTYPAILRELIDYSDDTDDKVVAESIHAIGRCARLIPECTQQCLTALIAMIKTGHDAVVNSAVLVLKYLVQTQLSAPRPDIASTSQSPLTIIAHLARKIDDIRHAQARACVLWLVGQYSASEEKGAGPEGIAEWAPDVLRKAAKTFSQEATPVKLQIVTLAAKLLVLCPTDHVLGLLSRYVFSLARYDLNYDVRDRTRMVTSLLAGLSPPALNGLEVTETRSGVVLRREQVKLVLFEGKSGVEDSDSSHLDGEHVTLGSLSLVTGKTMSMDNILPDWLERGVEPSLRETPDDAPPAIPIAPIALSSTQQRAKGSASPVVLTPGGGSSPSGFGVRNGGTKGPWMNLDKFYEDTAEEVESESEEEEDEDGDDNEGEDGEEESDEEEEEEEESDSSGEEDEEEATTSLDKATITSSPSTSENHLNPS